MITKSIICISISLILSAGTSIAQGTISFETIPGGSPSDGLVISNQFLVSHGVSFVLGDGSYPILAKTGAPLTAFYSGLNDERIDEIDSGQGVGSYFLAQDGLFQKDIRPLIINYSTPVSEASGYLLDVDTNPISGQTEAWEVQARDGAENIIETVTISSADPNAGDSTATFWSFSRSTDEIASIKFIFAGTKLPLRNVGIAFDNFSPAKVQTVDFTLNTCHALAIEWESIEGVEYQVQFSDRVGDTNWYNLGEAVIGNGNTNQFFHPIKGKENRRFYRVLISN